MMVIFVLFFGEGTAQAQVSVIAHPSVPVSQLDHDQLLDYYTGELDTWNDGSVVVILDLKTRNETRKRFYSYLGKSASRIKTIWIRKKLSGEGNPPQAFKTDQEIMAKVASTPGAIGFVASSFTALADEFKTIMVIPD